MVTPTLPQRLAGEFLGTFVLVLGGCGTAVLSAVYLAPNITSGTSLQLGVGFVGVALAFGFAVLTMTYAVGHVSGGHFNPAVTVGAAVAKRFLWKDVLPYVAAQVLGGLLAGLAIWGIAKGRPGWTRVGNMAANGFGEHSPSGYSLLAVLVAETILTAVLVYVVLGVIDSRSPSGFEPIAIGLAYAMVNLVALPISYASVNPARSTAVAFFNGDGAPGQLWAFWLAPVVGAAIAGATFHLVTGVDRRDRDISGDLAAADITVAAGVDPDAPRP